MDTPALHSQQIYKENQRFTQPWLWFVLISLSALTIYVSINVEKTMNIQDGKPLGDGQSGALIGVIITCLVVLLFLNLRLTTIVDAKGIKLYFFPLMLKPRIIPWEDINKLYLRQYQSLEEFGGWGVRIGVGERYAYNVKGNIGLQLELKDGKKILIGTNNPVVLEEYLQTVLKLDNYSNALEFLG